MRSSRGVRLPARGPQERPPLLDGHDGDRAGVGGGEVDLAWAWNDAAVQAAAAGAPIKSKRDTAEGLSTWVCGYVLLKDAPGSADKAYDYLNAINEPASPASSSTTGATAMPTPRPWPAVDPAVVKEKGYADVESSSTRRCSSRRCPAS